MKNFTKYSIAYIVMTISALVIQTSLYAQTCNVNEKYDKIISGYHSSIAQKSTGGYSVWGSYMSNSGTSDILTPQDINVTNYPALTGTILKAALGGNKAGAQVDQAILLTTNGLFAWGVPGAVLKSSYTSSATFARISQPGNSETTGLPTGVLPADVASMFAAYQTLVILTNSGSVYVLTQTCKEIEGNGSSGTPVTNSWQQVKTGSGTYLTGVTAVRGQVSSASYNAFMALTNTGKVYTWGKSTYLGDGNGASARNYATQMTLPAEFSASIPKMIGVTGGTGSTSTTKNTYFILGNSGALYSLGDNTQRQCGDFTTTENFSWVNVERVNGTNFNNISFFSVQEHNSSYPGIAAITTDGDIYVWGNNNTGMLGRTSNNASDGSTAGNYDPGMPVLFNSLTDNAISAEIGGHTLVYLKEGTSRFCYVGHQTNGSMGDGTATSDANGNTVLKHNCSTTPVINICGYVPVTADATQSTISAAQSTIWGDGSSTTTITIRLKDASGNNLTVSGGTVVVNSTHGPLGTVVDNNNGTYTVILTSATGFANTQLSFSVNGTTSTSTATVMFAGLLPLTWNNVSAYRQGKTVKVEWSTEQERDVSHFIVERSLNGSLWIPLPFKIPAANKTTVNNYQVTDRDYIAQQTFFRIKQVGMDGQSTYSALKTVYAEKATSNLIVYPVPATNKFYIGNIPANQLKEIKMINENGTMVKRWTTLQISYDIHDIATGIYYLKIETKDGSVEQVRLTKL